MKAGKIGLLVLMLALSACGKNGDTGKDVPGAATASSKFDGTWYLKMQENDKCKPQTFVFHGDELDIHTCSNGMPTPQNDSVGMKVVARSENVVEIYFTQELAEKKRHDANRVANKFTLQKDGTLQDLDGLVYVRQK